MAADKLSKEEVWGLAQIAAKESGLDPAIHYGMFMQESGGNTRAVSSAGAKGLAQFMPGTAKRFGLTDTFDPHASAVASGKYMKVLSDLFKGDLNKAIMAYNAGEGNIKKGIIPKETKNYLPAVLAQARKAPGGGGVLPARTAQATPAAATQTPPVASATPAAPATPSGQPGQQGAKARPVPQEPSAPGAQRESFKDLFQTSQATINTPEEALTALGLMPFIDPLTGQRRTAMQTTPEDRSLAEKFADYDEQARGQLMALNAQLTQAEQDSTQAPFSQYPSMFDDRLLKLLDRV